jgi:hypothetical protein
VDRRRDARPNSLGPPLRQSGEIEIGIRRDDRRAARRRGVAKRRRDDDAGGRRIGEPLRVERIGEKRDRRRPGGLERLDRFDPRGRIADQFAAEPFDDVAKQDFAHLARLLICRPGR